MTWNPKKKHWLPQKPKPSLPPKEAKPIIPAVQISIPEKSFFRPEEVAELMSVHKATVRRWIEEKKLKAVFLPNNSPRIPRAELAAFILKKSS